MSRPVYALLVALLLTLSASGLVRADAPTAEAKSQARKAYATGQENFRAGEYAQALASFQEAFTVVPNPVVLLSIAECQVRLGLYTDAVVSLQRYLAERPDAPDRVQVDAQIQKLREKPALLTIESNPSGAHIVIDGADTGKVTPADVELTSGDHVLELASEGYVTAHRDITLLLGARDKVTIELETAAPVVVPTPQVVETPPAADEHGSTSRTAAWVATGIAGVGLVAGGVLGALALATSKDFDKDPTSATADKGERLALFADVGFGVAAAAGVTALVLWLTDHGERPAQTTALRIAPAFAQKRAGVVGVVSF